MAYIPEGFEQIPKVNEEGKQLYLLPQPDVEVPYTGYTYVKTTDVTETPSMISTPIPMLDNDGNQKSYEMTRPTYDENGEYTGQEGTGQMIPMWTSQDLHEEWLGLPVYWTTIEEPKTRFESQPPIEITEDDPEWVEGLGVVYELIPVKMATEPIEMVYNNKLSELRSARDSAIYSTFKSNALGIEKTYPYHKTAADNLQEMALQLTFSPDTDSIDWYVLDDRSFVSHTRDQFNQVLRDAGSNVTYNKMQCFQLEAIVENAYRSGDSEAIKAVHW